MSASARSDSAFYCQIHGLLTAQEEASSSATNTLLAALAGGPLAEAVAQDRRTNDRVSYDCRQLVAWYGGRSAPLQTDFQLVHCRDLSPQGFSFFSEMPPQAERLIVALGTAPFSFFEAEAVRHEETGDEKFGGWIIGCRFIRRWTGP